MCAADPRSLFCLEGIDLVASQSRSGGADIHIRLPSDTTILRVMPFMNRRQAIEAALADLGFENLPAPGRYATAGKYRLAWAGQNCWHLICAPASSTLERDLGLSLAGIAAVSSASDGLLRLEIVGRDAASLMAKGCMLDLDHFLPGHCAVSLMAHTRIFIHRVSATGFDLMIPASHAASFWEWLCLSAAEFGMVVDVAASD